MFRLIVLEALVWLICFLVEKTSPHDSWETEKKVRVPIPLQGHTPSELTSPSRPYLVKSPPPPKPAWSTSVKPRTKPFNIWSFRGSMQNHSKVVLAVKVHKEEA